VIYGTIYDTDTLAVDYRGGLGEAEAAHLQGVATETLRDDLEFRSASRRLEKQ
jgi:hypothetical protein